MWYVHLQVSIRRFQAKIKIQISFNTQTSTQWDSFRHFAYQSEGKFYEGSVALFNQPNNMVIHG